MKYIPGTEFTIKKATRDFQAGVTYKVHHITPATEGVEYTFLTSEGAVRMIFESVGTAEKLVDKYSDINLR